MNRLTLVAASAVLALAFGPSTVHAQEVQQDRKDIRTDTRDIRQDRRDLPQDNRDIRQDRRDLNHDLKDRRADRRDLRQDKVAKQPREK